MLQRELAALADRLGDVRLLALIDRDGFPIANVSFDASLDLERMAAELSALALDIDGDYRQLVVGRTRQFSLLSGSYLVMVGVLSDDHSLLLVADEKIGLGRARFELRRARLTLEQELA